ncbi:MAG: tetratricopeptide repeat protein [Clostridia bacterium]|nr:tetratricopeptide repeat protein [Clostridia bacterium]
MADILSADFSSTTLEALYKQKLKKGDLLGALLITDRMQKNGMGESELSLKRAKVYYDMQKYDASADEWIKFLSVQQDERSYARAYNGLGACFYKMGETDLAGMYFNKQLRANKKAVFEYSNVTLEFYDEALDPKNNYKLAYPFDKADFSNLLKICDGYIKVGYYDKAIESLSIIPENSRFYVQKLISVSVCYFLKGEPKYATELIEKAHDIEPENVSVWCNAVSMYNALGSDDRASYFFNLLRDADLQLQEDVHKVIMVACERGENELVKNLGKTYLVKNAYDTPILHLVGIANYNLGYYENAENLFKKCYQITRSPIHYYYYQIAEKAVNKKPDYKKLEYSFDVPQKVRKTFLKRATELLGATQEEKQNLEKDIQTLAHYAFYSGIYELQSSVVTLLSELSTETAVKTLKNALIKLDVYDRIKSGIIGFLVADGLDEELPVAFSNVFMKIRLYKANFEGENSHAFLEAYSYAFAKLAHAEKDLFPLKESAENIYNQLKEKGLLLKITDVKALSAVMYELSSISKIVSRREYAKYFQANLKKIKEIKEYLY